MTTKAESSRYRQERSGPKKAKRVRHPRRKAAPAADALPGAGAESFLNRRDRSKKAARKIHVRVRGAAGFKSGR